MSRVYGRVRSAAFVVIGVLSSTAAADEPRVRPVRPVSAGVFFTGGATAVAESSASMIGASVELAAGWGRTQLFVENGFAWMQIGPQLAPRSGRMLRGALGVRWIARSWQIDRSAAVEMPFEAVAGAQRVSWDDQVLVRPEIAVGTGIQIRAFQRPRFTVRFGMRVVWTPPDDAAVAMRCTGDCAPSPRGNTGFMVVLGVAR